MISSSAKSPTVAAVSARVSKGALIVELSDGRRVSAPIAWFPRLAHGTAKERNRWRLIGRGHGIHWPDLDEDISVENLLAGHRSAESRFSLRRWLDARRPRSSRRRTA